MPKILIAKRGTLSARILVAPYHEELGRAILEGVIGKDRVGPVGLTNKNSGNSEISAPTRIYPAGPKDLAEQIRLFSKRILANVGASRIA